MGAGHDDEIRGWFAGRIPGEWFTGPATIEMDEVEVLIVGDLSEPSVGDGGDAAVAAARESRIDGWREESRAQRMRIASEAEHRFRRKVSWGATCGDMRTLFTTAAVPFMTRLRMPERKVLDTLVDAGVARSRAHALAWCVRLVGEHQGDWIAQLREALEKVEEVRSQGPAS